MAILIKKICFNQFDCHHTLALASRAASASAAMALCSWTGRRASLLQELKYWLKLNTILDHNSHFNSFNFDPPGSRGLVQSTLHCSCQANTEQHQEYINSYFTWYSLSITQYFMKSFGSKNVPQCSLRQQSEKKNKDKIFNNILYLVEWWAFSTLATLIVALDTR